MRNEDDLVVPFCLIGFDQLVAFFDLNRDQAAFADILETLQVRLFHNAAHCNKDDILLFVPGFLIRGLALDTDRRRNFLPLL